MQKSRTAKVISLILAIIMLVGIFPASVLADTGDKVNSYDEFITDLTCLEEYANEYVSEHPNEDTAALVINYVRSGVEKYTSGTWTTFCGPENTAFVNFVAQQDEANGTFAAKLRSLDKFTLPNGDEVEFAHMFGAMDMAYHTGNQKTADLGSWAGDICDLVQLTTNAGISGTVEEMAEEIRTKNDRYFLYDHPDPEVHSFGILDLYGDLDAFYILRKLSLNGSISSVMKNYFTKNLNDGLRAKFFLDNRFDGLSQKDDIRDAVYETYCANDGVRTLEGTYLPNGVNPDIRKACCYNKLQLNAFAVVSDSGTLPEESSFFTSIGKPFPAVCIRTSTERPEALEKGCFVLAGIDKPELLGAVQLAVEMNANSDFGAPVADYTDENVSGRVVKIIQSYTSIVNKTVWKKQ